MTTLLLLVVTPPLATAPAGPVVGAVGLGLLVLAGVMYGVWKREGRG